MRRFSYLFAYIVLMAVPSIILLFFVYHSINIKALMIVIFASFFIGGIFDIWATKKGKYDKSYIWQYNRRTTLNKTFMGMEIEDITLFLFLTPVFTIALWEEAKILVSTYDISIVSLMIGGVALVLASYYLVLTLTRPKEKKKGGKHR